MNDPELKDWWSGQRLTNLRYQGSGISGAGVSMQVIAHAFREGEYAWFSTVYGSYNDNLILAPFEDKNTQGFRKIKYDDPEDKRYLFGPTWANEFRATGEIRSKLGLQTSDDGFEIQNRDAIPFFIYSHDNCFFSIEPISDERLKRVVHGILEVHSFYLGQEIDWSEVEPTIITLLIRSGEIDLQSDPNRDCCWIPQVESDKKWFWKHFREGTIRFRSNKAYFSRLVS